MTDDLSNTHQIMNKIDDIKDKLSNQEYIDLCNLLKKKSENDCHNQLYRVRYFSQRMKLVVEEHPYTNCPLNNIICHHKIVICKFDEKHSESEIGDFIRRINDYSERKFAHTWSAHFTENIDDGITRLNIKDYDDTHCADITSLINMGEDHNMDEITCSVKFMENIVYSIEKVENTVENTVENIVE